MEAVLSPLTDPRTPRWRGFLLKRGGLVGAGSSGCSTAEPGTMVSSERRAPMDARTSSGGLCRRHAREESGRRIISV